MAHKVPMDSMDPQPLHAVSQPGLSLLQDYGLQRHKVQEHTEPLVLAEVEEELEAA